MNALAARIPEGASGGDGFVLTVLESAEGIPLASGR